MELSLDWKRYQRVFAPGRRSSVHAHGHARGRLLALGEREPRPANEESRGSGEVARILVAASGESGDFAEWIGARVEELAEHQAHRGVAVVDREELEEWIEDSLERAEIGSQIRGVRERAFQVGGGLGQPEEHFLIEAVGGWWRRALPATYGILICAGEGTGINLLVKIRDGRPVGYEEPDLSTLSSKRAEDPHAIVKFLAERYLMPVQGVFVSAADWVDWSRSTSPWRQLLAGLRQKRARLVPNRPLVGALIALRAVGI